MAPKLFWIIRPSRLILALVPKINIPIQVKNTTPCTMLYHLANTCTNWHRFSVFPGWNIDACSLDIGMKIDTFVNLISIWMNLPRQKIVWIYIVVEYIKSISHLLKYHPPNLRYPAKYYQKGSCFLTITVLLSNNTLSKYILLSNRSSQYNNIAIYLLQLSINNIWKRL